MRWISRFAALVLAALLCGAAFSQEAAPPVPEPTVAELRTALDRIPSTVETNAEVRSRIAELNTIARQADKFVASRVGPLADLNARLGELGNAPPTGAGTEDADITRQRASLQKERNTLDADIRLARLVAVDAAQRSSELIAKRRAQFEAQLTERAPSPLGEQFWRDIRSAWPEDAAKLAGLGTEMRASARSATQSAQRGPLLASVFGALLLAFGGCWLAERGLVRLAAAVLPPGRLRRSLLAVAIVAADVLLVGLAANGLFAVFDANGVWGSQVRELARQLAQSAIFFAFVVGLGRALLSNARPSWRLPPIHDAVAKRLAPFPWLAALVAALVWAPAQVNALIDASLAAVVATHVATALALTTLIGTMLFRLRRSRAFAQERPAEAQAQEQEAGARPAPLPERPLWVGLLLGAVVAVVVAIWILVAAGYVALASFMASQLTWAGIVAAAFYLLFKFVDDLFMAVVSSRSGFGQRLQTSFGYAPATLDQAAVVLSGLSRIALFFYMLVALAAPLGTGPGEVFQRSGQFGSGLRVGEFELVPGAFVSALTVLVAGFVLLRIFRRWLETAYLPRTTFEPGTQSSIATLVGYTGSVLVVLLSLSALGIGVNRIAWIASALSVGIGFGLRDIVQNFISGLILLAERPVKVGDWVVLGDTEGDVRRINVRATEIQLHDRSTLIVPNSEFITKTVRNMTLINAEGRVLIKLPMPLSTDAGRARDVMLAACAAQEAILATPPPQVTLEGIEVGVLIFQTIAYVQSPRMVASTRSDLLFAILEGLNAAQLPLAAYAPMLAPGAAPGSRPAIA